MNGRFIKGHKPQTTRKGFKVGQWSVKSSQCVKCETSKFPHKGKGLCTSCFDDKHQWETDQDEYQAEQYIPASFRR